jgi:hypothetical protein
MINLILSSAVRLVHLYILRGFSRRPVWLWPH